MRTLTAEPLSIAHAQPGESPVWLADEAALLWIDIDRGSIHRFDPSRSTNDTFDVGQPIGCTVPRARGGYVAGLRDGIALLDEAFGFAGWLARPEADRPGNRFNDGACDPCGRLWIGTMAMDLAPGRGALYRVGIHGYVERVLNGISISNGIGWSADGRHLYYVDSHRGVDVFDYTAADGHLARRRELVPLPRDGTLPDGLAVDETGGAWVAFYGAGEVRRYTPEGALDSIVVPGAPGVTCCAFGDAGLDTLYITTAGSRSDRSAPHAGDVLAVAAGVHGHPTTSFRG